MFLLDSLFYMVQYQVNVGIGLFQPFVEGLGEKDGTMLSARAAEGHHQIAEMPFSVVVNTLTDNPFHMVEENVYGWLGHQIVDDFPVTACLGLEIRFAAWVGQGTTVENEAASIAAEVVGIAFSERETVYGYGEFRV